jgi:hypothetical protein
MAAEQFDHWDRRCHRHRGGPALQSLPSDQTSAGGRGPAQRFQGDRCSCGDDTKWKTGFAVPVDTSTLRNRYNIKLIEEHAKRTGLKKCKD